MFKLLAVVDVKSSEFYTGFWIFLWAFLPSLHRFNTFWSLIYLLYLDFHEYLFLSASKKIKSDERGLIVMFVFLSSCFSKSTFTQVCLTEGTLSIYISCLNFMKQQETSLKTSPQARANSEEHSSIFSDTLWTKGLIEK